MTRKERVPPGQYLTDPLPVLHEGPVPVFDPATWHLRLFGLLEEEIIFSYGQITALPRVRVVTDIHCVTIWSKLDTVWKGVAFRRLLDRVRLLPEARYALIHCEHGYTTNLTSFFYVVYNLVEGANTGGFC